MIRKYFGAYVGNNNCVRFIYKRGIYPDTRYYKSLILVHSFVVQAHFQFGLKTSEMGNNRANQLNPNNLAFWRSRGYSDRPSLWMSKVFSLIFFGLL